MGSQHPRAYITRKVHQKNQTPAVSTAVCTNTLKQATKTPEIGHTNFHILKGKLAELMVQVDPKLYRKYITTSKKGEAMLYVRLSKALYGLLQSALLFYKKLRSELENYGFEVNPYDPCVANKIVNGTQMTVTWHVDDLKVSHKDDDEITKFLLFLGKLYGDRITVNRGVVHDYLGMDLDFSTPGKLRVSMIKYLAKIFKAFPETIRTAAANPAADHLLK